MMILYLFVMLPYKSNDGIGYSYLLNEKELKK